MLHGFTGSAQTWKRFAKRLGQHFTLTAADLLGHGDSDCPSAPNAYQPTRQSDALLSLLDALDLEKVSILGYSMGGRIALHMVLAAMDRVVSLVLEGTSPGIRNTFERRQRVAEDVALAAMIEREGVESFVDYWQTHPLFASQQRLDVTVRSDLRQQRLRNSKLGLANSLRGAGPGSSDPLWDRLPEITVPTLIISGELDQKYVTIGRQMVSRMPGAELAIVPDAGHAVHLERPDEFVSLVRSFGEARVDVAYNPIRRTTFARILANRP
jgi:2-succinyl-6-hydroxy-2,4-cyclohexadiene-1-carboxylate synthase